MNMRPCPFCGSNDMKIANSFRQHESSKGFNEEFHVFCNTCESSAGYCDSEVAAVKIWNQRAELSLFNSTDYIKLEGTSK